MDALHHLGKAFAVLAATVVLATGAWAQPIDISGVVRDPESGQGLSGFVVTLHAKGLADTTDDEGAFHLLKAATRVADRAALQRLVYSPALGFALRLSKDEQVIAEIRNGAGRTMIRGKFDLKAGDWSLKPRNLEPGLYTVMLWTGSRLRALRVTLPETDKNRGTPDWNLRPLGQEESLVALAPPLGVAVDSLRLVKDGWKAHSVAVQSWSQGGMTISPRRMAGAAATPAP